MPQSSWRQLAAIMARAETLPKSQVGAYLETAIIALHLGIAARQLRSAARPARKSRAMSVDKKPARKQTAGR